MSDSVHSQILSACKLLKHARSQSSTQNFHLSVKKSKSGVFLFELYFVARGVQVAPTIIDILRSTIYSHSIELGKFCQTRAFCPERQTVFWFRNGGQSDNQTSR
jgi:hypothetical protein